MTEQEVELQEQVIREMRAVEEGGRRMELVLRPASAFTLAAQLQLALRHPSNQTGPVAQKAREMCLAVEQYFAQQGAAAIAEVIRRGFSE